MLTHSALGLSQLKDSERTRIWNFSDVIFILGSSKEEFGFINLCREKFHMSYSQNTIAYVLSKFTDLDFPQLILCLLENIIF